MEIQKEKREEKLRQQMKKEKEDLKNGEEEAKEMIKVFCVFGFVVVVVDVFELCIFQFFLLSLSLSLSLRYYLAIKMRQVKSQ